MLGAEDLDEVAGVPEVVLLLEEASADRIRVK